MTQPTETPLQAARRLAAPAIRKGFKPEALHTYTDADGNPSYWRIRLKHPESGEKWIRPLRLVDNGFELGEPDFPEGKPLYRLDELAKRPGEPVILLEGEWCVDRLAELGALATTSGAADSAGKADWRPLAKLTVTLWPDNDEAGGRYATQVAARLRELGCDVKLIDVDALHLPNKGDAVDWLEANPRATAADIGVLPTVTPPDSATTNDAVPVVYRRLSEVQSRPIRWLWPDRVARGKVFMLAGNPGLGKSQVTMDTAARVTTGVCWPVDGTPCERGNVVFMSAEDDAADTIRPRLEAAGADLSRVFVIDAVKEKGKDGEEVSRSFNLKTDLTRLEAMLNEIGDVALIVIDPITAYLGNTDSHKNAEVRALLAPLGELAARHGGAVVCVSHLNKSGNSEALMCVTGSLAFVAAARAAYIVARDNDDPERRLFLPLKNNIGRDHSGLAFRVEGYHLPNGIATSRVVWEQDPVAITADEAMAPTSDPEAQTALDDAKEFLTGLLSQGPVAARRIFAEAKAASLSKRTICRAKTALGINPTKTGFDGGWEWSLP